jgi:hypothetical protein
MYRKRWRTKMVVYQPVHMVTGMRASRARGGVKKEKERRVEWRRLEIGKKDSRKRRIESR